MNNQFVYCHKFEWDKFSMDIVTKLHIVQVENIRNQDYAKKI